MSEGSSEAGRLLRCVVLETLLGRALHVAAALYHSQTRLSLLSLAAHSSPPLSLYTVDQSEVQTRSVCEFSV